MIRSRWYRVALVALATAACCRAAEPPVDHVSELHKICSAARKAGKDPWAACSPYFLALPTEQLVDVSKQIEGADEKAFEYVQCQFRRPLGLLWRRLGKKKTLLLMTQEVLERDSSATWRQSVIKGLTIELDDDLETMPVDEVLAALAHIVGDNEEPAALRIWTAKCLGLSARNTGLLVYSKDPGFAKAREEDDEMGLWQAARQAAERGIKNPYEKRVTDVAETCLGVSKDTKQPAGLRERAMWASYHAVYACANEEFVLHAGETLAGILDEKDVGDSVYLTAATIVRKILGLERIKTAVQQRMAEFPYGVRRDFDILKEVRESGTATRDRW